MARAIAGSSSVRDPLGRARRPFRWTHHQPVLFRKFSGRVDVGRVGASVASIYR